MLASTIVPVFNRMPERGQVRVDLLEQRLAHTVLLQQVAEVQDRRLVGQRPRQPQAHETPDRLHLVQQVLHPGVAQVVEQLHAVHPKHHRERVRPATATGLRIERLDARLQPLPRDKARPSSRGRPRAVSGASSSRAPTPRRSTVPSLAHRDVTRLPIMTAVTPATRRLSRESNGGLCLRRRSVEVTAGGESRPPFHWCSLWGSV